MNSRNKELVVNSVLAAMVTILGYVALDFQSIKITFEGFPVIIAGFLFGPLSGALVGGVGTFIYQLLRYGITWTTILWSLPYIFSGIFIGFLSKKNFMDKKSGFFIGIISNELIITLINTVSIYVDSHIYGWYCPGIITGVLPIRLLIAVSKGVVFAIILRELSSSLKKIMNNKARNN